MTAVDHEARFAAKLVEIEANRAADSAERGLWLSHHPADMLDRCTVVHGRHVCRRCLTLYPVGFAVALLSLVGFAPWPPSLDVWLIWGLCIPATLDFVGEHWGWWPYSARRQIVTTAIMATAYGRGLAFELEDPWSWYFWGPVLTFCAIWYSATVTARRKN